MKVNYVLMYGIPYVRYKEFETFEDISKFLVHKGFVNYSIFKKLEDKEEIEMIYRDNDIHYLENFVKEQDKEIKRLNTDKEQLTSLVNSCQEEIRKLKTQLQQKENIIKEVREYIKLHIRKDEEYPDYMEMLKYEYKELLEIIDKVMINNE